MNVFDVIGPIMVGPSSSHTAGAVRIGLAARRILGEPVFKANIKLCGSFAKTYKGHGTDIALVAGLLDMSPDDFRIKDSLNIAAEQHVEINFETTEIKNAHPNTAVIEAFGKSGKKVTIEGASLGGGSVEIRSIDGYKCKILGETHTLVIRHKDTTGIISQATKVLADASINIANMQDFRAKKMGDCVMVLQVDTKPEPEIYDKLKAVSNIYDVIYIAKL